VSDKLIKTKPYYCYNRRDVRLRTVESDTSTSYLTPLYVAHHL